MRSGEITNRSSRRFGNSLEPQGQDMEDTVRRIVTQLDPGGKSVFLSDGLPATIAEFSGGFVLARTQRWKRSGSNSTVTGPRFDPNYRVLSMR